MAQTLRLFWGVGVCPRIKNELEKVTGETENSIFHFCLTFNTRCISVTEPKNI